MDPSVFVIGLDASYQSDLPEIVKEANSENLRKKYLAVRRVRLALSSTRDPPIDITIASGILPALIDCFHINSDALQIEAAWTLANLAGGDSAATAAVVAADTIRVVAKVLKRSENWELVFQILWILGNVLGENSSNRSECIRNGMIETLERLVLRDDVTARAMNNVCWVLVNMARSKTPKLRIDYAKRIMTSLWQLTKHEDQGIVADAIWGLHYIANASQDHADLLIHAGYLPELVAFMGNSDGKIVWPATHTMGTICRGSDEQVHACLQAGVLQKLPYAFEKDHWRVTKDAIWLMSSVACGPPDQIEALIGCGALRYLTKEAHERSSDTVHESINCLSNLILYEDLTKSQLKKLIENGAASALSALLDVKDEAMLELALKSMVVLLERAGDDTRRQSICKEIEENGGLEYIENLQAHDKEEIYHLAYEIFDEYFPEESRLESLYRAERARSGKPRYEAVSKPSVPPISPELAHLFALRFGGKASI